MSGGAAASAVHSAVGTGPVRVREVTAESSRDTPEIPWHITPTNPGCIALQLRTTLRRVAVGAGLARNTALVDRVRALPGVPAVVTSPAGGTFVIGGDAWLGLCAIGVPRPGQPMPLDWMLHSVHAWLTRALDPWGVRPVLGRVEGAWCPGFSDVAVHGRKLAGLGFRMTRDWVVMRGVMCIQPIAAADFDVLQRCHRLIGVDIRRESATSLAEAAGLPSLTVDEVIARTRESSTVAESEAAGDVC
ncbi:MAG: lipoyl protein ligase domain-containing protein [Candidatus Dormibacteria bacterium]